MNIFSVFLIIHSILWVVYSSRTLLDPECKPPKGDVCVDIYECPYFKELFENTGLPRPHHVIKEIRKKQCGFVGKNPAVCCSFATHSDITESKKQEILVNEVTLQKIEHKNVYLLPNEKCGSLTFNSRITHGKETILGEYPWMALIVYNTDNGLDFLCGGSLISERYVLTAAHCILQNIIGVRLGEYNIITSEDCDSSANCAPPVQDFYIETAEVHTKYDKITNENDIALIRLAKPADLTFENVLPICLPLGTVSDLETKLLTVAGWGMTETGYKSPILRKAFVPIVAFSECQKLFEGHANISSSQLCAGGKRQDSCNGDSGGPLATITPIKGVPRHVQIGIVSFGPKNCGTQGLPGIYTRVDRQIEWILDTIKP